MKIYSSHLKVYRIDLNIFMLNHIDDDCISFLAKASLKYFLIFVLCHFVREGDGHTSIIPLKNNLMDFDE